IAVLSFKVKSYNEYFLLGRKISHKKHPVNVSLVSNIYGAVQLDENRVFYSFFMLLQFER
ncbi:hypothetical protein M0L17_26220, partial [Bacillaceae bacterium OS4b]|nr:hypothetical protein [Bacillaceae bacterium OS4b]